MFFYFVMTLLLLKSLAGELAESKQKEKEEMYAGYESALRFSVTPQKNTHLKDNLALRGTAHVELRGSSD